MSSETKPLGEKVGAAVGAVLFVAVVFVVVVALAAPITRDLIHLWRWALR
jgi:hypothetical protein